MEDKMRVTIIRIGDLIDNARSTGRLFYSVNQIELRYIQRKSHQPPLVSMWD